MEMKVEYRHKSYQIRAQDHQNIGGYTCYVRNIKIVEPSEKKIKLIGDHKEHESHRSVVGICIQNQTVLDKFPRGFGEIFSGLKYLEISNTSITMLKKEDFLDLGHLQGLWMTSNPIVALPNDLFINLQGLRFLSFYNNKLKFVGADILKPLKNLKSADFSKNTTIDMKYDGGEEQLAALNREIAMKCLPPPRAAIGDSPPSDKIVELEKRVQFLETKMRKLENEKEMLNAKLAQVAAVSQLVEVLQSRIEVLESLLG